MKVKFIINAVIVATLWLLPVLVGSTILDQLIPDIEPDETKLRTFLMIILQVVLSFFLFELFERLIMMTNKRFFKGVELPEIMNGVIGDQDEDEPEVDDDTDDEDEEPDQDEEVDDDEEDEADPEDDDPEDNDDDDEDNDKISRPVKAERAKWQKRMDKVNVELDVTKEELNEAKAELDVSSKIVNFMS